MIDVKPCSDPDSKANALSSAVVTTDNTNASSVMVVKPVGVNVVEAEELDVTAVTSCSVVKFTPLNTAHCMEIPPLMVEYAEGTVVAGADSPAVSRLIQTVV